MSSYTAKIIMQHLHLEESDCAPRIVCGRVMGFFTKGTIFSSVFNLLTTCIGAGTLALPYAFSQGGLIFASIVFLMIMIMAIIVGLYLFESKRYAQDICPMVEVKGYEDLAEIAFGVVGRILVLLILIIFLFLTLIAYMIYTRDQLDFVIQFILTKTGHIPDCSIFRNCCIIMALAFLPLFPVTLFRSLSVLQFTSTVSIFCVGFLSVIIAIKSALYRNSNDFTVNCLVGSDQNHIGLFPSTFYGAITCVSYCSLTFLCHFQLFSLEKELHRPKKWKLNFIVVASMIIAYCLYNIVSVAGYIQFGGITNEDIMTNFPNNDPLITVARIALFFTLLFSYPVLFHPARSAINAFIAYVIDLYKEMRDRRSLQSAGVSDNDLLLTSSTPHLSSKRNRLMSTRSEVKPSSLVWICETWALFAVTFLPAAFIPNVGYVWNFVGSIGGTLILYIFPTLFYLRLRYFVKLKYASELSTNLCAQYWQCSLWKDIVAAVILIIGVVILVSGNYEAVKSIIIRSHDSLTLCNPLYCKYGNRTFT